MAQKFIEILHKLPNICSISTAEAIAILMAIEIIIHEVHFKFINVSISPSTEKSLQNQFIPRDIEYKIQNNLKKVSDLGKNIIFM
jgi:hypothetical protein